jgi:alpha/beta superfamily hydrolase
VNQREVIFDGPAGKLEGMFMEAERESGAAAVLCHPHPSYGGSMHDMVLDVLSGVLLPHGLHCLRFNFRGVGTSEGAFDGGAGESHDAFAAAMWLNEAVAPKALWLAGYSFGAMAAWRASAEALEHDVPIERIILIAPIARMLEGQRGAQAPLYIAIGDCDDFTSMKSLGPWIESLANETTLLEIVGANHFFAGVWADLGQELEQALFGQ